MLVLANIGSYRILSSLYLLLLIVIMVERISTISTSSIPRVIVVYNSNSSYGDGSFQAQELLRGIFLGLDDSDKDSNLQPHFVDLSNHQITDFNLNNQNYFGSTFISLLLDSELVNFLNKIELQIQKEQNGGKLFDLDVFTPRLLKQSIVEMISKKKGIKLYNLQCSQGSRIKALLNRIYKIKIKILVPLLADSFDTQILKEFHKFNSINNKIFITQPILLQNGHYSKEPLKLKIERIKNSLYKIHRNQSDQIGILILSRNWVPDELWSYEDYSFRWFSYYPLQELQEKRNQFLLGMYSLEYLGSSNWNSPLRNNVIQDIAKVSDYSPKVVSSILAFDAAKLAVLMAKDGKLPLITKGLTGELEFDKHGNRKGNSCFFGISTLPSHKLNTAMYFQNSSWMLEDFVEIDDTNVVQYHLATTSVISRQGILDIATNAEKKGFGTCRNVSVDIIAHDPFSHLVNRYYFGESDIPFLMLIPNQFGYGLKLFCDTNDSLTNGLDIACVPNGYPIASSVHCLPSKIQLRTKRSPGRFEPFEIMEGKNSRTYGSISRDDTTEGSSVYDTSGTSTAEPTTEEITTEAAPTSKLPDLRGILRNTLPFTGACVGAATGCSVCVIVLGRLPLGALPAVCTGPCFVTTFANCGALLGRTFAETTVICTELFQQGRLDLETFLIDAEFGSQVSADHPSLLETYQMLASPIVTQMRSSHTFTNLVEFFALPWTEYMKFLMGYSSNFNWLGYVVHQLGIFICLAVRHLLWAGWEFYVFTLIVPFILVIYQIAPKTIKYKM